MQETGFPARLSLAEVLSLCPDYERLTDARGDAVTT